MPICITSYCDNTKIKARGLCSGCYQRANRATAYPTAILTPEQRCEIAGYALSYKPADVAKLYNVSPTAVRNCMKLGAEEDYLDTLKPLEGTWRLPDHLLSHEVQHLRTFGYSVTYISKRLNVSMRTVVTHLADDEVRLTDPVDLQDKHVVAWNDARFGHVFISRLQYARNAA